jgi:hypothetical protein
MAACGRAQLPLVTVQICLEDEVGISRFKELVEDIAEDENLSYFDGGIEAQESLARVGYSLDYLRSPSDLLQVHAHGGGEAVSFSATNLGLSSYEVVLSVNGSNLDEAGKLAELMLAQPSEIWELSTIPQDRGALPLEGCRNY